MESISYDQLLQSPPKLQPVPVSITGIDHPLLIHQFTMDQAAVVDEKAADVDKELRLSKQVLLFLRGIDYAPTAEDCKRLGSVFSAWQIREIFTKAMKLNGFGPEALREAQKN